MLTADLIQNLFLPAFANDILSALEDQATLQLPEGTGPRIAFTTDSFVVRPFLVPSLITLFGRSGFWPGTPAPEPEEAAVSAPRDPSGPGSAPAGSR